MKASRDFSFKNTNRLKEKKLKTKKKKNLHTNGNKTLAYIYNSHLSQIK